MRYPNIILAACFSLWLACPLHAQNKPTTKPSTRPAKVTDAAVKGKLERVLPKVDFTQTPLVDAIAELGRMGAVEITVDWNALQAASVDKATVINAHLRDIKLSKVLSVTLDQAQNASEIGYGIQLGQITITTKKELSMRLESCVYDIHRLLDVKGQSHDELVTAIERSIMTVVSPGTWKPQGGIGSMSESDGKLTVIHNHETQQKVASLIEMFHHPTRKRPEKAP